MGHIIEGLECLFNLPIVLFSFFPIGQQPWVELFPFPSSEEPIQILGLNLKKKKKNHLTNLLLLKDQQMVIWLEKS